MNAEQKQRALTALGMWHSSNDSSQREYQAAELMAALLQELVDAPEAEPFGYFKSEPFGWTDCAETDDGAIALYTAPQPPKLSDERILHHLDAILKASGSGLKNYSMHKTIEEMKQAFRAVEREILGGGNG